MRRFCVLVFFLVFSITALAQVFQIELVDANVGSSLTSPPDFYSNESNDTGLNQIFTDHNVIAYEGFGLSFGLPEPYNDRFNTVSCDNCDVNQFLADLNAYSSVVKYASPDIIEGIVNNVLLVRLVNSDLGIPTGFNDEIVVTNNTGLNQIFEDFNVRVFGLIDAEYFYGLACSCDATLLKSQLDNYDSVIFETQFQSAYYLLSLPDENISNVKVFPNPFSDKINIVNTNDISDFELFDMLGKQIFKGTEKITTELFLSTLNDGVYILRFSDFRGNTFSKKLIKN